MNVTFVTYNSLSQSSLVRSVASIVSGSNGAVASGVVSVLKPVKIFSAAAFDDMTTTVGAFPTGGAGSDLGTSSFVEVNNACELSPD